MSENHWDERPQESSRENPMPEVSASDAKANAILEKAKRDDNAREWKLLEKLVHGLYSEQRSSRRWGIFFKSLTFIYLFALLAVVWVGNSFVGEQSDAGPHTALVEIRGPIAAQEEASADAIIWALRRAFESQSSKAVIMRINSPGGSPVQSGYINDEIERLRSMYPEKKLYAVIMDIGASGAYYIAAAADEIYADKASLVGSIGVVASGFGFVDLMEKVGVERRLYTAGQHKAFLDPFSPEDQAGHKRWQQVLNTTHQQFIDQVKEGRGDRLSDDPNLFSGLVWTGEQALALGLIDGLGSSSYVARELVGVEKMIDYMPQPKPWEELINQFGVGVASGLAGKLGVTETASPVQLR